MCFCVTEYDPGYGTPTSMDEENEEPLEQPFDASVTAPSDKKEKVHESTPTFFAHFLFWLFFVTCFVGRKSKHNIL